jgi:hypothetical protein
MAFKETVVSDVAKCADRVWRAKSDAVLDGKLDRFIEALAEMMAERTWADKDVCSPFSEYDIMKARDFETVMMFWGIPQSIALENGAIGRDTFISKYHDRINELILTSTS